MNFTGTVSTSRSVRRKVVSCYQYDVVGPPIPKLERDSAAAVRLTLGWKRLFSKQGMVEIAAGGTMPCVPTPEGIQAATETIHAWAKFCIQRAFSQVQKLNAEGRYL